MKYFSMFSGIGGFEKGIEQSEVEMKCIGFSEVDKYAKSIYIRQFPKHKEWGDATKINTKELPKFDLLVGGFPCQAFSVAGKRKGFDDTRGTLFFEIARVLKEKRPRYFLLENVKGLLSHDKGQTFKVMLGILSELGYDVEWEVLNSKNFGVPQNRERIFLKGYLRRECGGEILSTKRDSREVINEMIWSWTSTRVGKFVDPNGLGLTLCSAGHNSGHNQLVKLNNKAQAQSIYDSNGLATTLSANGGGQGGKTGLYKVGNVSLSGHHNGDVYDENGIGRTLLARDYKDPMKVRVEESNDSDLGIVDKDFRIRRLTPRECERLQGFPDDWTKYGKDGELISNTQRYKCLGNAVTVNVIEFIIRRMFG